MDFHGGILPGKRPSNTVGAEQKLQPQEEPRQLSCPQVWAAGSRPSERGLPSSCTLPTVADTCVWKLSKPSGSRGQNRCVAAAGQDEAQKPLMVENEPCSSPIIPVAGGVHLI